MKTAIRAVSEMPMPDYVEDALRYGRHPQERTLAFHRFFGAPIYDRRPNRTFDHMSNERVAFRAAFILSEISEILKKGLGVDVLIGFRAKKDDVGGLGEGIGSMLCRGDDDGELSRELVKMLDFAGRDSRDLVEVADGLGDLNVVVNGWAIELGVDMPTVDQEVFASNMTKAGPDGLPLINVCNVEGCIYEDCIDTAHLTDPDKPRGKVLKGPNFLEPQLAIVLGLED